MSPVGMWGWQATLQLTWWPQTLPWAPVRRGGQIEPWDSEEGQVEPWGPGSSLTSLTAASP